MVENNTASEDLIGHRPFLKWLLAKMKWKSLQNFLSTCLRQFWLIFVWSMLFHNIRGKELAKRVKISLASHAAYWISYSQEIARKHLALNRIRISKEYNVALEDIHIGQIHLSPQCLCLWCLFQFIKLISDFMLAFIPMRRRRYISTPVPWRIASPLRLGDISLTIQIPHLLARTAWWSHGSRLQKTCLKHT